VSSASTSSSAFGSTWRPFGVRGGRRRPVPPRCCDGNVSGGSDRLISPRTAKNRHSGLPSKFPIFGNSHEATCHCDFGAKRRDFLLRLSATLGLTNRHPVTATMGIRLHYSCCRTCGREAASDLHLT